MELFAGCGGLSLGLETTGFELLLANELSPMAAESFAYNILGVDITNPSSPGIDKVKWILSQHDRSGIERRLRENPYEASDHGVFSDLNTSKSAADSLRGNLLVGSLVDLNNELQRSKKLRESFRLGFGAGEVDLVSGGPPCQSFSMAGLRQLSNPRNSLPWAFAEFVKAVQPKIALLENVSGILHAFEVDGERYHAWFEVAKAFATESYVPLCLHVNAKYAGAAQNRPRFIMIAFREDVAFALTRAGLDERLHKALLDSYFFYRQVQSEDREPTYGALECHHIEKDSFGLFDTDLFEPLVRYRDRQFTVKEAIDDLNGAGAQKSDYVNLVNQTFTVKRSDKGSELANHEHRGNNNRVKARFRLYQVMGKIDRELSKELSGFIRFSDPARLSEAEIMQLGEKVSDAAIAALGKPRNWLLSLDGEKFSPGSRSETLRFLSMLHTKKQTQRVLDPNQPAPAALSIPDDACHYHETVDQRTLTVREMARFQSFPDDFVFRSKTTTGGQMRRFEVPQYTQVGNAVPPMLGRALGEICSSFIKLAKNP